jgi:hypothetical protein
MRMDRVTRLLGLALALFLVAPARATVSTTTSVVEYTCNGTVKVFTVPFKFLAREHLRVSRVLLAAPCTERVLAIGSIYTVGGAGSATGGTVSLVTPPTGCATGYKLRIRRLTPRTQGTSLATRGPFNPKAIESALDRQTMIAQELNDGSLIGSRSFDFTVQGSPDTALVTATGSTVPRSLAARAADVANVKDFGAVGNGTTDDTAAIQAAINTATQGAANEVVLPRGYYRVTGPVQVGTPENDSYEYIVNRTSALTDTLVAAHSAGANVTANNKTISANGASFISLRFSDGAYLVADFAPSVVTPVLAYHLRGNGAHAGSIINPAIIGTASFAGGRYVQPANGVPAGVGPANKLIGLFASRGVKVIQRPFTSSVQFGVVTFNSYWQRITDVSCEFAAGACVSLAQANAVTVDNLAMGNSGSGLVFDGDASSVRGIHTEQVAQDLVIFKCDDCVFGPGYLEDVETADGTGKYAVTLGYQHNGVHILQSVLIGIRVGGTRPNKGGFRVWDAANLSIIGSRTFSSNVVDTVSYGVLSGTSGLGNEFSPVKWAKLAGGTTPTSWLSFTPGWNADTTAPVLGNGALTGRYATVSNIVYFTIKLTIGSTTTTGSGGWDFILPRSVAAGIDVVGAAWAVQRASFTQYVGVVDIVQGSGGVARLLFQGNTGNARSTLPFTWASGDYLTISGWYMSQ